MLEEAKRLLEAMGFRDVVPYAATPQRLMQICQRIDAARWSRARDVANVIAEFGAAPYVVFVMSVGQKKVCVPDTIVDGQGLYYVHEVDCRGRTVQCADLARAILDLLSLPVPAELLLAIHPNADELCAYGILPPKTCRRHEREERGEEEKERLETRKGDDAVEEELMRQLEKELQVEEKQQKTQPPAPPPAPAAAETPADEAIMNIRTWPRRDKELLAYLAAKARGFDDLLAAYLAEEFGCTVEQMHILVRRILKEVDCRNLYRLEQ